MHRNSESKQVELITYGRGTEYHFLNLKVPFPLDSLARHIDHSEDPELFNLTIDWFEGSYMRLPEGFREWADNLNLKFEFGKVYYYYDIVDLDLGLCRHDYETQERWVRCSDRALMMLKLVWL